MIVAMLMEDLVRDLGVRDVHVCPDVASALELLADHADRLRNPRPLAARWRQHGGRRSAGREGAFRSCSRPGSDAERAGRPSRRRPMISKPFLGRRSEAHPSRHLVPRAVRTAVIEPRRTEGCHVRGNRLDRRRCRGVAQPGSAFVWGTKGRRFKSGHSDHSPLRRRRLGSRDEDPAMTRTVLFLGLAMAAFAAQPALRPLG